MSYPDLSIIIPVYNSERLISRTLNSVLSQTSPYTFEVICVDDGSTDHSVELIEGFKDNRIKLISQQNSGPSEARNKGLKLASGRYVSFIDADDFWENGFVDKTIGFLESHHECVAVSVGQRHLSVSGESFRPTCINDYKDPVVLNDFFEFWATYNHVCTGSVTIRSEAVKKVGGFRRDLLCNEDWELWALIGAQGNWGFIPQILFTSDGIEVSRSIGWLQKMQPRWNNAQSVAFWEKRIKEKAPHIIPNKGYIRKVGIIASDIAQSLLLSKRENEARREVKMYGAFFEKNNLNRLLILCSHFKPMWDLMCKALNYRERHRKI